MIAETGSIGNANGSLRRNLHFWLDHVFDPVAFACGDIAGQRVTGKGRNGNVMRASDSAFKHTATPNGDFSCEAAGVYVTRAVMAAHASELDIDDAGGVKFNGSLNVAQVVDGLVETQRCLQLLLQLRVEIDIVPPERLFHHEQLELIKALQVRGVVQRVCGIRIDGQKNIPKCLADRADVFQIL